MRGTTSHTSATGEQPPQVSQPTSSPHIDDVPPRRTRNTGDLLHAAFAVLFAVAIVVCSMYLKGITSGVESDAHTAGAAVRWFMDVPASLLQQATTVAIVIGVLAQLLISREWLQSATSVIAMFAAYASAWGTSLALSHWGLPQLIGGLDALGTPSGPGLLPDMYAGLSAFLVVAGPRRLHRTVKWGWNALYTVAVLLVALSWNSMPGSCVSFALGCAIGLVIRFIIGTHNQGAWGMQLVQALRGIDIEATRLSRRVMPDIISGTTPALLDDDLVDHSRLYDVTDVQGRHYLVSVLDSQSHMTGYIRQLWQWIRLTGVAMRRDRSASDACHHHLAMLLGLRNAGLSVPDVYGTADSAESSILVFGTEHVVRECNLNTLTDEQALGFMRYLNEAHRRGYTHRSITPDTLAIMDEDTAIIAGWNNGDCASSPANIAFDNVQLLALIASLIGLDRAIACARQAWGEQAVIALLPFVQKAAVPAATKAHATWDNALIGGLRNQVRALVPDDADAIEPVTLSRFNLRSFVAIVLLIVAAAVVFTQLRPREAFDAIAHAQPMMAILCVICGLLAWAGSGLMLAAFMDRHTRSPWNVYCSQAASGLTAVSMPAGVGPAFINLQFVRKSGYSTPAATAIMSATWVMQAIVTVGMLLGIGLFTGHHMLSGMIPTNTLVMVIGVVVLAGCTAMAIPPLRRLITTRYWPLLRSYGRTLVDVISQPRQCLTSAAGALILNLASGFGFWAALMAFGHATNPIETTFIFLLANTLGSAVPTPGGLGAVEAALAFGFTSVGVPSAVALSATLVFRVAFYWIRIPLGALAMQWLNRHNLI